jgi:hypothetical protein
MQMKFSNEHSEEEIHSQISLVMMTTFSVAASVDSEALAVASGASREVQINNSNNSINDTWILSSTGFYLNAEFVKNNSHKDYRISVEGDFNQKTITYNSGYILGSC